MTKRMVDSITPTDIPVNDPTTGRPWDYVLGYVDGAFGPAGKPPSAWTAQAWARFPNSVHVRCAVFSSTLDADVLDRETGDATAAQAVAWVQQKRARGDDPTVYVGLSDWPALQAAFNSAGVPHPHYGVAAYPGAGMVQQTLNGITSVFHQYADPNYGPGGVGSGGHYDLSVVVDGWLSSTPLTTPSNAGDDMGYVVVSPTGNWGHLVESTGKMTDLKEQIPATATTWNGVPIARGLSNDADIAILQAQGNRWEAIQNVQANPTAATINATVPTRWRTTETAIGVHDTVAVTS